jgi:hypothetical protein
VKCSPSARAAFSLRPRFDERARTHARLLACLLACMQGNFAVHKWYGIILNKVSEFQGTSATIKNSFIVKEHWAKVF